MIVGYSEREEACKKLQDMYRLTREQAQEIIQMAETMGWMPIPLVAEEAVAAATNDLAFQWEQPYEVRKSVAVAIFKRLLGNKADEYVLKMFDLEE